ncbi:hypothetical protein PR202_ga13321 [Eleusine coracana subsp. coracana]|uniref:Uncharacterized protein n=1 Tax=Eleusine coracana subsp. coracana TaxID=191504 RepID=A0AAV5CEI2_ELECO|nr:hypothetical protein PR202_ga13321 [Eleusine coracana subsp. coracana]
MATSAVPLSRAAPIAAPRPSSSGQRVPAAAHARRLRSGRLLLRCRRRSLTTVSAAAGTSSGSAPARAWDSLGGISVLAAGTGEAVPITDLWDPTEGVAVVALLRHFGCFCCWELASVLKESMEKFDSAGAKLIAIGVGTPDKARILADRAKIYSRLDSIKKATKNYTLEGTPADITGVWQQGGMFVFRGKELVYAWRDEGTGDHAPLDDVLGVCCSVPVASLISRICKAL